MWGHEMKLKYGKNSLRSLICLIFTFVSCAAWRTEMNEFIIYITHFSPYYPPYIHFLFDLPAHKEKKNYEKFIV